MPCIRAWLQPCRWRRSIQGFSPRCLPPCQVRETIGELLGPLDQSRLHRVDRKSTRLNSSHRCISYAVFCLKKKTKKITVHNIRADYSMNPHHTIATYDD